MNLQAKLEERRRRERGGDEFASKVRRASPA